MVSPGAPGGVRDPCAITSVPKNIHSAATRPVGIRVGLFIVSSSMCILEGLEGLEKGKEVSPVIGTTPLPCFGSVSEAVEALALGQCEGLAHPGSLNRGLGDEVFTLLDGEVQDHSAGFGVDTQENRTGTPIANLLHGRALRELGNLGRVADDGCFQDADLAF